MRTTSEPILGVGSVLPEAVATEEPAKLPAGVPLAVSPASAAAHRSASGSAAARGRLTHTGGLKLRCRG